jgi:hypothetical protein
VQINNIKSVNEAMELVTSALQENVIFKGDEAKNQMKIKQIETKKEDLLKEI